MTKRFLKALGLSVAMVSVGLMVASDALALPGTQYVYTYYVDAAHSDEVGFKWLLCGGEHGTVGQITSYYDYESVSCNHSANEPIFDCTGNEACSLILYGGFGG